MESLGNFEGLHRVGSSNCTTTPNFNSNHFRVVRFLLRLLSLWRPQSACFMERRVYPIIVNLILFSLGVIRSEIIQTTEKSTWMNIHLVFFVHDIGIWLGHILGNCYFSSRDLETNVLHLEQPITGLIRNSLKSRLKYFNVAVIGSYVCFTAMLCSLYIAMAMRLKHGRQRFSSDIPYINGPLDNIMYGLVIVGILFDVGVGLALPWIFVFIYICFASRLKMMEGIYVKWGKSSVDAVDLFQQVYAHPLKLSWRRISWWFLAHNIVSLAIPLYGYELAKALSGSSYYSKHLPQFVCYLVYEVTIWFAPILVAEQIKRREKTFKERVNNICPSMLNKIQELSEETSAYAKPPHPTTSRETAGSTASDREGNLGDHAYTFVLRGKELNKFLLFLNRRSYGLVARGYSLQVYLSFVSLTLGAISFFLRFEHENIVKAINISRSLNSTLLS